ncbi:MAG: alpha-amylase family protein [Anaerolineae bacterium]
MMTLDRGWLDDQARLSLERLRPRLEAALGVTASRHSPFMSRLEAHFPAFFERYFALYGDHYDFFYHLEQALLISGQMSDARPASLVALDATREQNPDWFESQRMMGAVGYVDLFANDLRGLRERIPYLRELGLTYLHLMPLYAVPEPHNDGGYAVSSFREVNPKLGTMQELAEVTGELRAAGISLVLDFVFNHTSDEHEWAKRALNGETRYQQFYRMFDDRSVPDQYEPKLREIFPEQAPGSFTYRPEIRKWVWTTFYPFQWDLNYANPDLFNAMLGEMLFLANQGAEVLRLDAVPFIWKELGTDCENRPEAHLIIQAYNALMRIAAPALLFKSEAIVHPRDVRSYISPEECQLSYNPIMMVALWDAVATRDVTLFTLSMRKQFALGPRTSWVNYLRSHDDIGWGFADEDAAEVGINGFNHRRFLNSFFTGEFEGSFATGTPFNFNPRTLDMRISGTMASLAGLEQAVNSSDPLLIDRAVQRILAMFSVVLSAGGIPLIYLGDEVGTLNDYGYRENPTKSDDSRWVHRPAAQAERYARRQDASTVEGRIFLGLKRMIELRQMLPVLADGDTVWANSGNAHVLAYSRHESFLALVNFSDFEERAVRSSLGARWIAGVPLRDLISDQSIGESTEIVLTPYQVMWLVPDNQTRSST